MYSPVVQQALEHANLQVGERLRYSNESRTIEGRLMPRPDTGDGDCLILKLDSGYNVGLSMAGAQIQKIKEESRPSPSSPSSTSPTRASSTSTQSSPASAHPSSSPTPLDSSPHSKRPPILFLSTGGTIASKVDYQTGAVHPQTDAQNMVAAYPRLSSFAPLHTASLFSILSDDMHPGHWTQMAQGVAEAFKDGHEGVVLSHGTDTMGYSAAALSFALENLPGPVILTGSQRSPDRASTDATQNLYCAAAAARSPLAAVAVCMHASSSDNLNHLHWGTRVRKTHTSGRWAFRSIGCAPLGRVQAESGQMFIDDSTAPKRDKSKSLSIHSNFSSNVHLAWVYPGLSPKTVASWSDYDGVVLAATGLGHAPVDALHPDSPHALLPALRELVQSGVLVAVAPQTLDGRINLSVYSNGRAMTEVGILGHGANWLPETAYVKMCWSLAQEKDPKKAATLLLTPRAHDITSRSPIEETEESD